MFFFRKAGALLLLVALMLCASLPGSAARAQTDASPQPYHAQILLGIVGLTLQPAHRNLYLLGAAHSEYFEGWRAAERQGEHMVLDNAGAVVRYFPRQVQFRITATTMVEPLLQVDLDSLNINGEVNDFLLKLAFRLKVFHGLDTTNIEPDAVDLIGMPASVPYEERVFRASFTLPQVSIQDRVVLEVLDPQGERIGKFHLEF